MMQTFKILKGIDRLDPGGFFSLADKSLTRGHSLKIVKQRSRLTLRQNAFSQRVINDWNALPAHVIDSPTLNTFKFKNRSSLETGALQFAVIRQVLK